MVTQRKEKRATHLLVIQDYSCLETPCGLKVNPNKTWRTIHRNQVTCKNCLKILGGT